MPWNGSGVFNRTNGINTGPTVWNESFLADRDVSSAEQDTHDEDIATGLENCLTVDGQNQPSGDLPMGGLKHTNVDDAAARNQYSAVGQVQDGAFAFVPAASVGGTADAITLSVSPAITAYAAGQQFAFVVEGDNTGAATVDVSSLGTKAVQKSGAALVADDIKIGDLIEIRYDGTQFQMTTPARTPVFTAGVIDTAEIADDAVTLAKMAPGTDGNLITYDASGDPAAVATGTSGQVLTSNGAGAAPTMEDLPAAASGLFIGFQTFDASGTYTPTAGTNSAFAELQGSGGGGGGADSNATPTYTGAGGGGEGERRLIRITSLGATETVTINSGGAGGSTSGGNGAAGGTTEFGAHATANGGAGGIGTGAAADEGTMREGGIGGTGGSGGFGLNGQAGASGAANQETVSSNERFSVGGVGGGQGGGAGGATAVDGTNGGGGGGARSVAIAGAEGGAGGDGYALIWEYS